MKWLCGIAMLCALALPIAAGAQVKSIFRFQRGPDREAAGEITDDGAAATGDAEDPQVHAGSTRQGMFEETGDENAFPIGPVEMAGAAEGGAEVRLPGAPAIAEPVGPLPPLVLPRPNFGQPPKRSQTRRDEPRAAPGGIPPRPDLQKPFGYTPAPRNRGTVTGYDAAVAPLPINIDPPTPPMASGPNAAPARPLPRLAPYGRSLPPNKNTPPASIPR